LAADAGGPVTRLYSVLNAYRAAINTTITIAIHLNTFPTLAMLTL
jgi:hypothetical protein